MARIVGGIGCSHAPSIAHSFDRGLQKDPMWAPLYDGYAPAKAWLDKLRPPELEESDMLDTAHALQDISRLSCQILVSEELDGLTVTTPPRQI